MGHSSSKYHLTFLHTPFGGWVGSILNDQQVLFNSSILYTQKNYIPFDFFGIVFNTFLYSSS